MRQWHVNPKLMCDQHLLGEHVEHHMFVGALKAKQKLDGYIKNGLLDINSLFKRHNELAKEMTNRGMNHKSPLIVPEIINEYPDGNIDSEKSLEELKRRCSKCRARML